LGAGLSLVALCTVALDHEWHRARQITKEATFSAEGSPSYAGWRVTLAAFIGVMVSFAAMVPVALTPIL
jgi:hypothetical protein